MRILRTIVACAAISGVSTFAIAGDLHVGAELARPNEQAAQTQAGSTGPGLHADPRPMPKTYLWAGSALFVSGMAVALNGFLNNRNGEFPEFGEARSTNVRMGGAGLGAAFGGGVLLFLGKERAARAPSITVGHGRVAVSKQVRW
jgi:hypothetical protein